MLTFVPTPIGNLQDITLRALRCIQDAQIIIAEDTRVAKRLIFLLEEKELLAPKERAFLSFHSHTKMEFFSKLTSDFFEKEIIYITDAGMPCISDPGSELVKYCQQNGIKYDVLPGANALLTSFAASGFGDKEFLFYGFLPHKKKDRVLELKKLLWCGYAVVLYESPLRIAQLVDEIADIDSTRRLFLAKELTKLHQRYFLKSASELQKELKSSNLSGEWCVCVEMGVQKSETISLDEVLSLELPPKCTAKIVAKIKGISPKEAYTIPN